MGQLQVKKTNWWHERLADWMLANPQCNIKDAAQLFNCHVGTLYLVKNSDAFQVYFRERSDALSSAVSDSTVSALTSLPEKVAALADAALEQLTERVLVKGRDLPVENLTSISDMALRRLGYGAPNAGAQQAPNVTTNVFVANADEVNRARERLEARNAPKELTHAAPAEGRAIQTLPPEAVPRAAGDAS